MKSNKLIDIHRIHIPFCRLDNARITTGNQLGSVMVEKTARDAIVTVNQLNFYCKKKTKI